MTSPHLIGSKPPIDPVEALRVLMADLRALADRLALKEQSAGLQQTLKAAQDRVCGPRAVVMLLSEHEDLKRRFLERLLGPHLAQVPNPTVACTRLEYGAEPECTVTMPHGLTAVLPLDELPTFVERHSMEKAMQTIRLPNPALKDDLAVIDTPIVENGEPAASLLECAEQADAWIFVLQPNHELNNASEKLLRQLPDHGARLEMVVEGAEMLSAEERLAARARLMHTLRERCSIETSRLTLIASTATEGDAESFWHGRFATFHSVMMRRGRERRMEATREIVKNALSDVGAEIDSELKSIGLGLRHARLRLGMKDLEGLRTRFDALGQLDSQTAPDAKTVDAKQEEIRPATGSPTSAEATAASQLPLIAPLETMAAATPDEENTSAADSFAPPPLAGEPAFVSFRRAEGDSRWRRRLSVNFSENVSKLTRQSEAGENGRVTLAKRSAGIVLAVVFVCVILWALAPRGSWFGHEAPSQWEYQQSKRAAASGVAPAAAVAASTPLPQPGNRISLPESTATDTPGIPSAPLAKHGAVIRTPLARPIHGSATAGVAVPAKRHHRHMLGLGKLWHWVRHRHKKQNPKTSRESAPAICN
ncbi:MAG: hypothetical protein ACJ71S_13070 [Acidobacteriaceae bacterium]